jgi:hypothetical protein
MNGPEVNLSEQERENLAIHGILLRILEKWRIEIHPEEEDLERTLILSSESAEKKGSPSPSRSEGKVEGDLPETVIIPPKESRSGMAPPMPSVELKGVDSIQKPEESTEKDGFLEETVILKPAKVREKLNE